MRFAKLASCARPIARVIRNMPKPSPLPLSVSNPKCVLNRSLISDYLSLTKLADPNFFIQRWWTNA